MDLDDNSVAGSEDPSVFIALIVSKSKVRAQLPIDFHSVDLNDTNVDNRFDLSLFTVKLEETEK